MSGPKTSSPIQSLIKRVISLGQSKDPFLDRLGISKHWDFHQPLSKPTAEANKMAEEEDFSSLPLTDRWVHKVCYRYFSAEE